MTSKRLGKRTVAFSSPPSVISFSNIGGKLESRGPLADYFDVSIDYLVGRTDSRRPGAGKSKKE